MKRVIARMGELITGWLTRESDPPPYPLCDFKRLGYELRAGDVILVEGRSRVAEVIKLVTASPWTHAALYIGRPYDIAHPSVRKRVASFYDGDPNEQLLCEAIMGQGMIITPLSHYKHDHLRICRPAGLAPDDAQAVISHAVKRLGWAYDMRLILDLARFLFPWSILPRRWRSSLFRHNAGKATKTVCSIMLAEAFSKVDFPILPFIDRSEDGSLRFLKRNPRLFAPCDFDYSPYFHIIKYPFLGLEDLGVYRKLPWHDGDDYFDEHTVRAELAASSTAMDGSLDEPQAPGRMASLLRCVRRA